MSRSKRTAIHVSPTAPLLLALFVMVSSPLLLAALLLAAVLHEMGHYWMLRRLHARVTALRITALGAEMQVAGRLSYGGEVLAAAAGPAVNLLLALLLGLGGRLCEALYLFSGAQLVLGAFNLLPIPPLDGGRFVVEIFQKGTRKTVSQKAMNYMSLAGMALFLGFFVIMLNQDIQRFVFGNWG